MLGRREGPRADWNMAVYVYFFGTMVVYLLTCAEALQVMVWQYEVCLYWYTIASLAVVIPLAQIKTMHGVSFVGIGSTMAILLAVALVMVDSFLSWGSRGEVEVQAVGSSSFMATFSAFTTVLFAYGGQGKTRRRAGRSGGLT